MHEKAKLVCFIYIKPQKMKLKSVQINMKHVLYTKSVCATNFGPLGEIGANFSLQFSSRTQFAKISNKKVIAENQCEKHKKIEFN